MSNKPNNKPAAKAPANAAKTPATKPATTAPVNDKPAIEYNIGDEISYASPQGMLYGTVVKLVKDPASPAIEVEFEDGRKEVKKVRDRALRLLRRATGKSEIEEQRGNRGRTLRDEDVESVRRSEQRRGSRH